MLARMVGGLLLLVSMLTAGCGTVASLCVPDEHDMMAEFKSFGGVRRDCLVITGSLTDPNGRILPAPILVPLCVFDLSLSIMADSLILPFTLSHDFRTFSGSN